MKYKKSFEISEKFHDLVPGAGHTYSKGEDQFPRVSPHIMSHGDGAYCWDVDGNKYVDWGMGNRVFILGHNNEVVNNAVIETMKRSTNFTRPGILEYEAAKFFTELMPTVDMVKFGKNGSDVTAAAIKLARAHTGRTHIGICRQHPFFSTQDWFIGSTPMNSGVLESEIQYTVKFDYNDISSVEKLLEEYPDQMACLILEPLKNDHPCDGPDNEFCKANCKNGVCAPGKENFLTQLRELCTKHGVVLIFDEIICGIRFDLRGVQHMLDIQPDLTTFGKCISNGFSFSLLGGKKEIMELGGVKHKKKRVFLLSQTHSSETIGLAAAMATIKECQRLNVTEHIWRIGKLLKEGFNKLAKEIGVEDYCRIIGYDCNPQILCTTENGEFWPALHTSFHEEVIDHGVLIPWITITYSHTEKEFPLTFEALRHGMNKIKRVLEEGNVDDSFEGEAAKPVWRVYN